MFSTKIKRFLGLILVTSTFVLATDPVVVELPICTYSESKCNIGSTPLASESHCILEDKSEIYLSSNNDGTCSAVAHNTILIKNSDSNKAGTFGTDSGLIYIYSEGFKQIISSNYLHTTGTYYLYGCNDTGVCSKQTPTTAGYYLSGPTNTANLIKCTTAAVSTCVVEITPKDGYYLNNGLNKATKPVIKCENNVCTAMEISKTKCGNGTGEQVMGGLIKDDNKIKLCVSATEAIDINATSPIYRSIKISNDNDFPGVNLAVDTTPELRNIKISKDGSIYELKPDSTAFNSCIANTGCTGTKYYFNSPNICQNKSSNDCVNIKAEDVGITSEKFTAGIKTGYIYFDSASPTEKKDIAVDGVEILFAYQCTFSDVNTLTECKQIKQGVIYDPIKQKVVTCNGWAGEGCTVSSASTSCADGDEGKLIISSGKPSLCFGKNVVNLPSSGPIYFPMKVEQINTIYGLTKSELTFLELNSYSAVKISGGKAGYTINQSISTTKKALYSCSDTSLSNCNEITPLKGYYLNGGDASTIISCSTSKTCTTIAPETSGCTIGKVYKTGTDYYLCKTNDGTVTTTNEIKINDASGSTYVSLKIAKSNDFPSINNDNTLVSIKVKDKVALLMEDDSLPECASTIPSSAACTTDAEEGQHCIHKSTKKIYKTTEGKCKAIEGTNQTELFFFDTDFKKIPMISSTPGNYEVIPYQCTYTSDFALDSCEIFKGYIISSSNTINCNGWKGEGCTVATMASEANCASGKGEFQKSGEICFNTNSIALPTAPETKIVAVELMDANSIYGKGKGIVFLTISSTKVMVTSTPTGNESKYYVNANLATGSKNLIKCTGTSCLSEDGINSTTEFAKYYLDSANIHNVIKCEATTALCTSVTGSLTPGHAYIDASSKDANNKFKKVITCNDSSCTSTTGNTTGKVYIDATNEGDKFKKLISCAADCTTDDAITHVQGHAYLDASNSSYVIICSGGGTNAATDPVCSSNIGSSIQGHAYIDAKQSGLATVGGSEITVYKSVISCSENNCVSNSKTSGTTYFIDTSDITKLITCDGTQCLSAVSGADASTTILKVDGISPNTHTINCFNTIGCLSVRGISVCADNTAASANSWCNYQNQNGQSIPLPEKNYCIHKDGKIYLSKTSGSINSCAVVTSETLYLSKDTNNSLYAKVEKEQFNEGFIYKCDTTCTQYFSTYYLDTKTQTKNNGEIININYMYHCGDDGICLAVNKPKIGYYIADIPTKEPGITLKYTKLIHCEDTKVSECSMSNKPTIGSGSFFYYIDTGKENSIIKCSENDCISISGNTGVGYLDEGNLLYDRTDPANPVKYYRNIITCSNKICTTEDKCKNLSTTDELYFVDGNNNRKIITCKYNTSKYECISGNAVASTDILDGSNIDYTIKCDGTPACASVIECRVNTGHNCEDGTYHVVKDKTSFIEGFGADSKGFLYYCEKDNNGRVGCTLIEQPGYYFNLKSLKAFICKLDGSDIKCEDLPTTFLSNKCAQLSDIGKIFIDNNEKIALCLNFNSVAFSAPLSSTVKNYFITYNESIDTFKLTANTKFGLIKIGKNLITSDVDYKFEHSYFVYINPKTFEVLENSKCPNGCFDDPGDILIAEYTCANGNPICVASA